MTVNRTQLDDLLSKYPDVKESELDPPRNKIT